MHEDWQSYPQNYGTTFVSYATSGTCSTADVYYAYRRRQDYPEYPSPADLGVPDWRMQRRQRYDFAARLYPLLREPRPRSLPSPRVRLASWAGWLRQRVRPARRPGWRPLRRRCVLVPRCG